MKDFLVYPGIVLRETTGCVLFAGRVDREREDVGRSCSVARRTWSLSFRRGRTDVESLKESGSQHVGIGRSTKDPDPLIKEDPTPYPLFTFSIKPSLCSNCKPKSLSL